MASYSLELLIPFFFNMDINNLVKQMNKEQDEYFNSQQKLINKQFYNTLSKL